MPKERFVLYSGAERDAESEGWPAHRLTALLAGLLELFPWLRQWHHAVDPATGLRMGDYFADFLAEETRALGLTLDDLRRWSPSAPVAGRRRRRTASSGNRRA